MGKTSQKVNLYLSFVRVFRITYEFLQSFQVLLTLHKLHRSLSISDGCGTCVFLVCSLAISTSPNKRHHIVVPSCINMTAKFVLHYKDCVETRYVGFHISEYSQIWTRSNSITENECLQKVRSQSSQRSSQICKR